MCVLSVQLPPSTAVFQHDYFPLQSHFILCVEKYILWSKRNKEKKCLKDIPSLKEAITRRRFPPPVCVKLTTHSITLGAGCSVESRRANSGNVGGKNKKQIYWAPKSPQRRLLCLIDSSVCNWTPESWLTGISAWGFGKLLKVKYNKYKTEENTEEWYHDRHEKKPFEFPEGKKSKKKSEEKAIWENNVRKNNPL